jgi:NitT/TauT family transport system substrate-binding protein
VTFSKIGFSFARLKVAAAFGIIGLLMTTMSAQAQAPLKKVRIAYGGLTLNISYPWLEMPLALNYWREEGYDVDVVIAQSSLQAIQLLVAGQADIAQINSGPLVQAAAMNNIPIRDIMTNTVIDWSLVVLDDSPYRSIKDLKGKSLGVASLGTGGVALLRSFLAENGIDPDKDADILPVGMGTLALQSLRSDKVQGMIFWGSAIAAFENAGTKFRYFSSPSWRKYPDFSLAALQPAIARDPAMMEAVVRGAAKASLFAMTNGDCTRKLQWAHFPETKPTGADEPTLVKWDLHYLDSSIAGMKPALDLGGGKLWGKTTPEQFSQLQDFFLDTKLIDKKLANPADYIVDVPDFFEKANDFDHAAVEAQAKACTVS